ncbi:ERB1, BOP1, ribosome biogenesis protein ERB1 [Babesia microti strain RI]|uniref:ERB1, BOP1, ribosome biogenesis protein ERB1 n=1 Tax=Babesia microti (strain RI) TaxID=1133968 RepID=I7IH70_BABMR|nr:ERB1, BOP1, ribosome biogenesis protein ERB1 [Babesia microti strain RI]CCF75297.2 ERB1, BOP1, ribosome biogenesis protein ERB1 [Babesia microti strain RI]|eukprot:XP_021337168.1 ERB1, BOP1, ribosome biogenesis protein ERB1 [Babesia microti strain RI]
MVGKKNITKDANYNSTKFKRANSKESNANDSDIVRDGENDCLESDDDESSINNICLVPVEWYKYEDHCGYDREGERILKPSDISELNKFISGTDSDNRIIKDQFGNVLAKLTDKDIELIERICKRQYPNKNYDPEAVFVEFDKSDSVFPVRNPIYRKDSYSPSKNEYKIIKKIIKSIRERDYSMSIDRQNDMPNNKAENDIWNDSVYVANDREKRRIIHDLPAPKLPLPKSDESYNPPPHLIPSESDISINAGDGEPRYVPRKYDALRFVPGYKYYLIERFERCMDLYLSPRASRVKMNIDIKALLASVPKMDYDQLSQDISVDYYTGLPVNIARIDHTGRFVAIVSGNYNLQVFSLISGRSCFTIDLSGNNTSINDVTWHPHLPLLAMAHGTEIVVLAINLNTRCSTDYDSSDYMLSMENDFNMASSYAIVEKTKRCTLGDVVIKWKRGTSAKFDKHKAMGFTIHHHVPVLKLNFHSKGSYLAAILQNGTKMGDQVIIHSVPKKSSVFLNVNVSNIKVNQLIFHPANSQLILGTTQGLRLVNLRISEGKTVKKLSGLSEVLSLDVNNRILIASGDNGTVSLYDLEDPNTPFKSFNFPNISHVMVHKVLPLLYITQDGGKINVFYIKVDDNESISVVPCKQLNLKCKMKLKDFTLHPYKSWFVTTTGDTKCLLYV